MLANRTTNRQNIFPTSREYFMTDFDRIFSSIFDNPKIRADKISLTRGAFKLDIAETETAYEITAEMPGVDKGEIELELDSNGVLTLGYKKDSTNEVETKKAVYTERAVSEAKRKIYLPEANCDTVRAKLDSGILAVLVEKRVDEKCVSKIEIE